MTPIHARNAVDATSSNSSLPPQSDAKSKNQQGQQDQQHAVDLYQKGMEIAHNAATYEDHCRAIEHFSLAIAIRGDQARFFLARGNAFRAINELEHAARDYGAAITIDDCCALYYANRGACYRKLNQPVRALEDLKAAIDVDGRKGPHYLNRALVLQESGFYREAIVDFTKALDDGSSSSGAGAGGAMGIGIRLEYRALQGRGFCFRRVGNLPKCIDDLQAAIKLDARNSSGFSALALAYAESGDYDLAIEFQSRAIETNAANASYYSHRGICYYRKGDLFARQCLADLNRCIQLDGSDPQAYFYRGAVRLALALGLGTAASSSGANSTTGPPSKAPSSASPSVSISSNSPPVVPSLGAGGFLTPAEQLEAAYADIEMAWTLSATRPQYQTGMAMILQLKQKYEDAAALLLAVSERERESVLVKYHLALCCYVLRDHERALALLTDVIEGLPTEPLFIETRGQLLQELECHTLAICDFSAAILIRESDSRAFDSGKSNNESNPTNTSTLAAVNYYLRGESFLRLEEFQRALDDCSRSVELGYTDMSALNARAMAFRGLGKLDRAINDLNVRLDVRMLALRRAIADCSLSLSRFLACERQQCLAQAPSNDVFHFHRALCLIESGLHHDALSDLHTSLQSHPADSRYASERQSHSIQCALVSSNMIVPLDQDAVPAWIVLLPRPGAARMSRLLGANTATRASSAHTLRPVRSTVPSAHTHCCDLIRRAILSFLAKSQALPHGRVPRAVWA